jgi:predicted dehydrogenase
VTEDPIGIGIIGAGSVMQGGYLAQLERLRGRGLVALLVAADRHADRRDLITGFGIKRFTTDAREVLDDPAVDLVLILTSGPSHAELAAGALERGKHVLVEKPMATTLAEADRLVELAEAGPGLLVCAPHVVLSPSFQTIWRRLRRGDIGRVHLARARYGWAGPTWTKWFYEAGGGALFDVALYNITALTGLLGPVRRVVAMTGVAIPHRMVAGESVVAQVEDNAHVLLDFGDVTFASVSAGFTMQQYRNPAIELYGSTGTIQMLGDDWAPQGHEVWQQDVDAWRSYKDLDPGWAWTDGLRHLVDCIRAGTTPLITPRHARHVLEVTLAATEASRTGRVQTIASTFEPLDIPSTASTDDEPVHLMHDLRR